MRFWDRGGLIIGRRGGEGKEGDEGARRGREGSVQMAAKLCGGFLQFEIRIMN